MGSKNLENCEMVGSSCVWKKEGPTWDQETSPWVRDTVGQVLGDDQIAPGSPFGAMCVFPEMGVIFPNKVYATRRATFRVMMKMKHRQGWDTVGVAYLSKTFPFCPVGVTVGFDTWWGKVRTHFRITLVSGQGLSRREDDKGQIKEGKDSPRE